MIIDIGTFADTLQELISRIAKTYESADSEAFLRDAALLSHELPLPLRQGLLAFKLLE